jgi:hypothetical protein
VRNAIFWFGISAALWLSAVAANQPALEERIKSDLIGCTMGGREKCWRFQSADQIKDLVVRGERREGNMLVYEITLTLRDRRAGGEYRADAEAIYEETDGALRLRCVGLRSLFKLK